MMKWAGDDLPVSAFEPGGYITSTGTTAAETAITQQFN
jgi:hypothetical protein